MNTCAHRWKVESPQIGHRGINARCRLCGVTRAFPKSLQMRQGSTGFRRLT